MVSLSLKPVPLHLAGQPVNRRGQNLDSNVFVHNLVFVRNLEPSLQI